MRLYRVGLFTDVYFPNPNGVSTSVYLLLKELRRMGHEAWVIAPWIPEAPQDEDWVMRVRSVDYPFYEGHRVALPSYGQLPVPAGFEIVHTHTPLTLGVWGMQYATRQGIPHVSTFHTNYEKYAHYIPGLAVLDRYTHVVPRLARAFYNRADLVITPTQSIRQLVESYEIERPTRIIPTGINTEVMEQAPEIESPWPAGTRRLLTVGRLGEEKSMDVVLKAFAKIASSCNAYLVHLGEGPKLASLQSLAAELGVGERVKFLGPIAYHKIGGYYRLAELFLFASETETQGLVLWEAQVMGVPVVAVGADGTLDGVENEIDGFLVPPGDYMALAERALWLLTDEKKRKVFAENARVFAMARGAECIAEEIVSAYDEAGAMQRAEPRRLIFPFPILPEGSYRSPRKNS